MRTRNFAVLMGAVYASCCLSASAVSTIYDNSFNDLELRLIVNSDTVGDELNLAGTARHLTHFSFEYWVEGGDVTLHTKLYLNDGPDFNTFPTPGTLLYDGGAFNVGVTDRSTLNFHEGVDWAVDSLFIPADTLTLVVSFSGIDQGESAGVDLYDPPVVGSSAPDYWFLNGSDWELREITDMPVNIASRFEARVPDATGIEIVFMSGLGLVVAGFFFRRKAAA